MPVTVHKPNKAEEVHADAKYILVKDGHLVVMTTEYSDGRTVAIYAPGDWRHAVVTESSPA